MAHDVFISYSSLDKVTADAACAMLEKSGIRCWIAPRDVVPGSELGTAVIHAIDASSVFVLIFSSSANTSRQISREVQRAIHQSIPVVPVRIEDVPPTEALAYFVGAVHWLDALTPPLETHLQQLAESVRALLQAKPNAQGRGFEEPRGAPAGGFAGSGAAAPRPTTADAASSTGMFHDLMNFSFRRNWKQAIAWYVVYFVIGVALGAIVGGIIGVILGAGGNQASIAPTAMVAGQIVVIPYVLLIGVALVYYRAKDVTNILLVLADILLSIFFGALGGLIPLAYLTTRPTRTQ
jgi:hypothetical protein